MSNNEVLPHIHIPGVSADAALPPARVIHHVFILDASGSMDKQRTQTIVGFNEQVQGLRQAEKEFPEQQNTVTLVFFNGTKSVLFSRAPSTQLQEITEQEYDPRGTTRLYATVGEVLEELAQALGPERSKSESVIVTIMTDGEDSGIDSDKWNQVSLRELIQQLQNDNHWVITFIGANIAAERAADTLGIARGNVVSVNRDPGGISAAYTVMLAASNQYRTALRSCSPDEEALLRKTYFSQEPGRGLDLTGSTVSELTSPAYVQQRALKAMPKKEPAKAA